MSYKPEISAAVARAVVSGRDAGMHYKACNSIKLRQLICLLAGGLVFLIPASAQREMNLPDHDAKPFYFGFTAGGSRQGFKLSLDKRFLQNDSITMAEPLNSGGFNIGLLTTAALSDHFQLRINPQLIFSGRRIAYQLKYPEARKTAIETTVQAVNVSFPLQLKMQSDRIGNFRFYVLAGFKADLDVNNGLRERKNETLIKIKKYDYGPELGLGCNFFFSTFILSPEIKISNGTGNLLNRDGNLKYSAVFDKIQSRMVALCLHIEG